MINEKCFLSGKSFCQTVACRVHFLVYALRMDYSEVLKGELLFEVDGKNRKGKLN